MSGPGIAATSLSASPVASIRWRPAVAVALSATAFAAMQGLTYPLLALAQQRTGHSSWAIGINAAMMPLGLLLAGPVAPRLIARHGSFRVAAWSLAGSALCVLAIGALPYAASWMGLRLAIGALLAFAFTISDTWVSQLIPDRVRSRAVGAYCALLCAGYAAGPGLLLLAGSHGPLPFLIGASCPLCALIILAIVRDQLPQAPCEHSISMRAFARHAPLLLLSTAAAAFAEQTAMSLLPIYAVRHGLSAHSATLTLLVMLAGSIILLYPIGWLADRLSPPWITASCGAATALLAALLPTAVHTSAGLLATVFLWGGTYYAIYTQALTNLGQRYDRTTQLTGNAALGAAWGVGGLLGTPLTGAAMRMTGPTALPIILTTVFALLTIPLTKDAFTHQRGANRGHVTNRSGG